MVSNAIETQSSYWYGFPPWAMWNPEPVPGSAPFRTDPNSVRLQQIHRVRPTHKWRAGEMERRQSRLSKMNVSSKSLPGLEGQKRLSHLGQNIDRYV